MGNQPKSPSNKTTTHGLATRRVMAEMLYAVKRQDRQAGEHMDRQAAQRLVARIEREPGWQAEASYQSGAWVALAWSEGESKAKASAYTSSFDWHYSQAKVKKVLRSLKALRFSMRRKVA